MRLLVLFLLLGVGGTLLAESYNSSYDNNSMGARKAQGGTPEQYPSNLPNTNPEARSDDNRDRIVGECKEGALSCPNLRIQLEDAQGKAIALTHVQAGRFEFGGVRRPGEYYIRVQSPKYDGSKKYGPIKRGEYFRLMPQELPPRKP